MSQHLKQSIQKLLSGTLSQRSSQREIDELTTEIHSHYCKDEFIPLRHNNSGINWVCVKDILYYKKGKHEITFHTINNTYTTSFSNHFDLEDFIISCDFLLVDKATVVNKYAVKNYNTEMGFVYFDEKPTENTKSVQISLRATKEFQKMLGKECDVSPNTNYEYSQVSNRTKPKLSF